MSHCARIILSVSLFAIMSQAFLTGPIAAATSSIPLQAVCRADDTEKKPAETWLADATDTLFSPAMVITMAIILWATAPDHVKASIQAQLTPRHLASNFAKEYGTRFFATLCHETGHAMVQSAATGRNTPIHLGASVPGKESYLTIGNVHIDGFNPMLGFVPHLFVTDEERSAFSRNFIQKYAQDHALPSPELTPDQLAAMIKSPEFLAFKQELLPDRRLYALFLLAGGFSGILGHHGLKAVSGQPIKIDSVTISQLFNMFFPLGAGSDAAALWRDCVGVSPDVIDVLVEVAPFLRIAAEIYLACNDENLTPGSPLHSKVLVGTINYFSRGYFHFHA